MPSVLRGGPLARRQIKGPFVDGGVGERRAARTEDEGDDRTRAAYRTNYERLAQVKAAWDPTNLFRTNKNIGVAR